MDVRENVSKLPDPCGRNNRIASTFGLNPLMERASVNELHRHPRVVRLFPYRECPDSIRMADPQRIGGFPGEASSRHGVDAVGCPKQLDGIRLSIVLPLRRMNHTHAPAADDLAQKESPTDQ